MSLCRYEPLWNEYGVDLLLFGHVHAYERTNPVANYTADPTGCAPTYITIGAGAYLLPASTSLFAITIRCCQVSPDEALGPTQAQLIADPVGCCCCSSAAVE